MNVAHVGTTKMESRNIRLLAVNSSSIAAVGYDPHAQVLAVRFHNGAEYRYRTVPKQVFDDLLAAPSIGLYYHENVRNVGFLYDRC